MAKPKTYAVKYKILSTPPQSRFSFGMILITISYYLFKSSKFLVYPMKWRFLFEIRAEFVYLI